METGAILTGLALLNKKSVRNGLTVDKALCQFGLPNGVKHDLEVRKFFCRTPTCPRKIFTERLPDLVQPWARMTDRLRAALQALGLATGGEGGAGLAPKPGMRVAPTTLLRGMREVASPVVTKVRVVGVDDWAYKRGETYGTIVVE